MDSSCLMNMRRASSGLKSIAEQSVALKKFPVKISSSRQLQRVNDSQVQFNNFILNFKSLDEQSHLNKFAELYGGSIRIIKIDSRGGHENILYLLAKCDKLEDVSIIALDATVLKKCSSLFESVLCNFRNLRKLVIDELGGTGNDGIDIFLKILHSCEQLEEFKIPSIFSYNQMMITRHSTELEVQLVYNENGNDDDDEEDWEQGNPDNQEPLPNYDSENDIDILIHPIIDYIKSKVVKNQAKIKCINVYNIALFGWKSLTDFLDVCRQYNVQLFGVKTSQWTSSQKRNGVQDEISYLCSRADNLIQSIYVSSIKPGFPFSMFDTLKELRVDVSPVSNLFGLNKDVILTMPQLTQMHVKFVFGVEDSQNQLLIKKLFKDCERPTVRKLKLEWLLQESCLTVNSVDLVNGFKNITEIELSEWDALDDEFSALWTNLLHLEKITIKDCRNLTNKAFVGGCTNLSDDKSLDKRPLNGLKSKFLNLDKLGLLLAVLFNTILYFVLLLIELSTLIIRDISGNVNEDAIMGSFRWIKLRRFEYESTVIPTVIGV